MGIFIPNMKLLCLSLLLGGVCTDDDCDDTGWIKHGVEGSLVDKPNEPKSVNAKACILIFIAIPGILFV